jgi:hypothetical protein
MDFSDFMESDRAAKKRDPKEYARGVAADEKQAAKAYAQTAEGIAERKTEKAGKLNLAPLPEGMPKLTDAIAKADAERAERKAAKASGGASGSMGMNKLSSRDLTKNFKAGGKVSSASSRADGCAIKGKTRGRMV